MSPNELSHATPVMSSTRLRNGMRQPALAPVCRVNREAELEPPSRVACSDLL
jgi:hypothetical protein